MRDGRADASQATRRDVLTALCSGGLALGLSSRIAAAADASRAHHGYARGRVYEDFSSGHSAMGRDCGLPGVMVSNGRDVTLTARDGSWRLPLQDGEGVFVIKPANWRLSSRPGLPAPGWVYHGGAVQDPQSSIDFALERCDEAHRFDVLLVADTQASNRDELGYVRQDLLAATRGSAAAFALHHGDVMGDDLSLLPEYMEMIKETGLNWHHCPGNHDMNFDAPSPVHALETWKRLVGPPHYAFEYGKAVFILLNNVEYLPSGVRGNSHKPYRGRIGDDQLHFVRNVLRHVPTNRLVVVSMHIPLQSFDEPGGTTTTTSDRNKLLALLGTRPHTISFSGHSHTTEHHYFGRSDGFDRARPHHHQVLTAVCGSWWSGERDGSGVPTADSRDGSPRGHHVLSVDGSEASTRFVPANAAPPGQMRLMLLHENGDRKSLASGPVKCCDLPATVLLADVFDGGPQTRVIFEIENSGAVPMHAGRAVDPYVAESYARSPLLCKPWLEACVSSHIWHAPLPAGLPAGLHILTVTATNDYGVIHRAQLAVDVVG